MLRNFRRSGLEFALSWVRQWAVRLFIVWLLERLLLSLATRGQKPPDKPADQPEEVGNPPTSSFLAPPIIK